MSQHGLDLHTARGGINTGDMRVRSWIVGVVDVWVDSDPGMGPYRPRVTLIFMFKPPPMSD